MSREMTITFSHLCSRLIACAATCLVATAAVAQLSENYQSIQVTPDKPTQLNYHASAHKNCTAASPPTIRVIEAPKSGTLTVRQATLVTKKFVGCPPIKTPARVVFYQARGGYEGPDHVKYEVTSENGEVATYDVAIIVKEAPASSNQPGPRKIDVRPNWKEQPPQLSLNDKHWR